MLIDRKWPVRQARDQSAFVPLRAIRRLVVISFSERPSQLRLSL